MNSLKAQPTPYKDFIKQIQQASENKENKKPMKNTLQTKSQKKITLNRHTNSHNNVKTPHNQSTSIWEKSSNSQIKTNKRSTGTYSHNQSVNNFENNASVKNHKKKDKALCYYGFVKQATKVLTEITNTNSPQLLSQKISYIQYLETLKALQMIKDTYEPFPNDLVSELWGQYITGQSIGNFILVLCSILGISFQGDSTSSDEYIKKKYESLMYTRLELNRSHSTKKDKNKIQYSFRPQISERSRKIATSCSRSKSKRKKHHGCINTQRSNTSIGYGDGFSSMEQYQQQQYNHQNNWPSNKNSERGMKKSQALYQISKQRVYERKDRSVNEVQYEKNKQQLTFKPNIHKSKSKDKQKCRIKGENITISRMIKGRVQREVRKIINAKGLPYNEKIVEKLKKQKYEELTKNVHVDIQGDQEEDELLVSPRDPSEFQKGKNYQESETETENAHQQKGNTFQPNPLQPEQDLIIDVYITEDHKEKLIIRKGQSLEDVATSFVHEHNLPQSKIEQLIELLKVSINHALSPIDQLVEQQDMEMLSARTCRQK